MLLSRAADSLYWLSRYLERAEHTARLLDVRLDLGLDRAAANGWDFSRLFAALRVSTPLGPPPNPGALIDALIFDPEVPESVLACVTAARENARQVREEISSDMWRQLNALFLSLKEARSEGTWSTRPHYICRLVIDGVIGRIDRSGLALVPDDGPWPESSIIDAERSSLVRWHHERRGAPRLPLPQLPGQGGTPLRDVSATGLRYALGPNERAPATGSHVEGELRLDTETVIPVRGQVVRHIGREIAVALDPPGLTPEILALLRRRFFPEGADSPT